MPYTDNTVGANTRNSAFVELLGTRKIFYFDILFSSPTLMRWVNTFTWNSDMN